MASNELSTNFDQHSHEQWRQKGLQKHEANENDNKYIREYVGDSLLDQSLNPRPKSRIQETAGPHYNAPLQQTTDAIDWHWAVVVREVIHSWLRPT